MGTGGRHIAKPGVPGAPGAGLGEAIMGEAIIGEGAICAVSMGLVTLSFIAKLSILPNGPDEFNTGLATRDAS